MDASKSTVAMSGVLGDKLPRVGSPTDPPQAFSRVVLEQLDKNLFLARKEHLWKPRGRKIIFGGQVIGQSLTAATKTVKADKVLHSCHGYFLQGGKTSSNIIYTVMSLQEGRSFATRVVTAQQDGRAIFICVASFQKVEISSLVHQYVMPIVPSPEHLCPAEEYFLQLSKDPNCPTPLVPFLKERAARERENIIDVRFVLIADPFRAFFSTSIPNSAHPSLARENHRDVKHKHSRPLDYPKYTSETKQLVWIRTKTRLSGDVNDHRCVLGYISDMFLLGTAVTTKVSATEISMIASRDHSMWFHSHEFRMDEWMLYELESPRAGGSRGLAFGRIFKRNGELAVSVTQEGVVRLGKDRPKQAMSKKTEASAHESKL